MTNSKEIGYALKEAIFKDEETRERLLEVKKDIIKEFVSSIKNNNSIIENIDESIEKYLINDGSIKDIFQDIFRGCWLSLLLPESIDNLNKVKEKISSIQKIPTSEELSSLKSEILNMSLYIQTNPTSIESEQETTQTQQRSTQTQQTITQSHSQTHSTIQRNYTTTSHGTSEQTVSHSYRETLPEITEQENKFIKAIYERVSKQIGKPYSRGGTSPSTGFDCSGLRYRAFKEEGINFSERLNAHKFSDADVDLKKDQVRPGDFMFWDQKPGGKKKHDSIYHIEMIISKPYTKNGKTFVRTIGSSTDAKDDRGNYVGKGVQIREREMKDYRHYGRPTYYYQLAQYERTGSRDNLRAGTNKPSQDLQNQVMSA